MNTSVNPRGIPTAPFIENVQELGDIEHAIESFTEMLSKYRFMESNMQKRCALLSSNIPEMQKALDVVKYLPDHSPITRFELCDTLFAKAKVQTNSEVYLWLGANVMLAFTYAEAEEMLQSKIDTGMDTLAACSEDLAFLREQITTTEVNIARSHNYKVRQKRSESSH